MSLKANTIEKNPTKTNHIFTSMKTNNGTVSASSRVILRQVSRLVTELQAAQKQYFMHEVDVL